MPTFVVKSEQPIATPMLKEELARIKKRDGELNFRGQKTEEYLNYFVGYKAAAYKKIEEQINALNIPRFKPEHVGKLLDVLPTSADEVKAVLQGFNLSIGQESCKKIAEAITGVLEGETPIETAEPPKAPELPVEAPAEAKAEQKTEESAQKEKPEEKAEAKAEVKEE